MSVVTSTGQLVVAKDIIKEGGFGSLYKGLSAGLLRQATYTTARLGIFQGLSDYLKKANDGKVLCNPLFAHLLFHMCVPYSQVSTRYKALPIAFQLCSAGCADPPGHCWCSYPQEGDDRNSLLSTH